MTRQENILTLTEHLEHWKRLLSEKICDQSEGEKTIDALQNAIKELEQEHCADMVSRDAMWEVLQRLYGTEGELVEELMSLPPVLPQRKMGKWIYNKKEDSYRCNLCYCPCHKNNLGAIPTEYCAGCGAVMEVEE